MSNRLLSMQEIADDFNAQIIGLLADFNIDAESGEARELICEAVNLLAKSLGSPVRFVMGESK